MPSLGSICCLKLTWMDHFLFCLVEGIKQCKWNVNVNWNLLIIGNWPRRKVIQYNLKLSIKWSVKWNRTQEGTTTLKTQSCPIPGCFSCPYRPLPSFLRSIPLLSLKPLLLKIPLCLSALRMWENNSKQSNRQRINLKNIQATPSA